MADYSLDFNETFSVKQSVNDGLVTGHREIDGLEYDYTPQAGCEGCPAHAKSQREPPDGAHVTVERHFCSQAGEVNPIPLSNRYKADTIRQLQQMVHYLNWLLWWKEAAPAYPIGGSGYTPFITSQGYPIVSASGKTLTLRTAGRDPRNTVIFNKLTQPDPLGPYVNETALGVFPQPGDMCTFSENSVIAGRVQAKVVAMNFKSLPATVGQNSTFTVTLDQEIGYAAMKAEPESSDEPRASFWREAYEPERWVEPKDPFWLLCAEKVDVFDLASLPAGGVLELKGFTGQPGLSAFPIADGENGSSFRGTFKLEASSDGGNSWADLTASLRVDGRYPRFVVEQLSASSLTTKLYLGATDYFGAAQPNLVEGKTHFRVRHCPKVASRAQPGAHQPCQDRCEHAKQDHTKASFDAVGGPGFDKDLAGRQWFCAQRNNPDVTLQNLQRFKANCAQHGSCRAFAHRAMAGMDPYILHQLICAENKTVLSTNPGSNSPNDFIILRLTTPSILWLMTPEFAYRSLESFSAQVFPESGGYVLRVANFFDGGDNERLGLIKGAVWNYVGNGGSLPLNWETNRWGNNQGNLHGVLYRSMPAIDQALTQFSETASDTNDPAWQIRHERLGRKIAPAYRDAGALGGDVALTARAAPGFEGENRIQRFRQVRKYLPNLVKSSAGQQQRAANEYAFILPSTGQGAGERRILCQLGADGAADHGRKRIGGRGLNGRPLRIEKVGDRFRIHCYPGLWAASRLVVPGGGEPSFDEIFYFWASGNVVAFPPHYRPDASRYNNPNLRHLNTLAHQAVAGDTVAFQALPGRRFYIRRAEPGAGMDFSGLTIEGGPTDIVERVGEFFSFEDFADPSLIEITSFETTWTPAIGGPGTVGEYSPWFNADQPAIAMTPDTLRETTPLGDPFDPALVTLIWNRFSGPGLNEGDPARVMGGDRAYLSFQHYAFISQSASLQLLGRRARVGFSYNGVAQPPREINIDCPAIDAVSADEASVASWQAFWLDDATGQWEPLTYGGVVTSLFDPFLEFGKWYWNPIAGRVLLHPNLTGRKVWLSYTTTESQALGGFPPAQFMNSFANVASSSYLKYLKQADIIDLEDNAAGELASNLAALTASDFFVNTAGVFI